MTAIPSSSMRYPERTVNRAARAIRCAPFCLRLYTTMMYQSVALSAIAGGVGVKHQYTQQPIPELVAENELLWLIQVGLLRREVDGQGLTDSFRLTPLGRQLVEQMQQADPVEKPTAQPLDLLYNALNRWFQIFSW